MDRYINIKDIENTFEHLTDEYAYTEFLSGIYVAKTWIENLKPTEAESVRHGHWIKVFPRRTGRNATYKCSVCKKLRSSYYNDVAEWDHCPCGAKMDRKEDEE